MTELQSKSYRWLYDAILSKLYDLGLKIGLTPFGEYLLRKSVYDIISPFITKNDKILDLCCGTGTLTIFLTNLLYPECELTGVDLSFGQILKAKKKNKYINLNFEVMDANKLLFKDEYFDRIIISAALHEMNHRQRLNVLSEAFRVLKQKGHLIVFEHHEPQQHFRRLLYNFYLGFIEDITSHSRSMQHSILTELSNSGFKDSSSKTCTCFYEFFPKYNLS